ncbi:hypothetical protein SOASR032_17330 [Pragia fontium]|nr:hypothetical protein SOASR032_17330 [Pragia fontium]
MQTLMEPFPTLAEAICIRVGCHNIYNWLLRLEQLYELSPHTICPELLKKQHRVVLAQEGLTLTLSHPHVIYVPRGDKERWCLESAEFEFVQTNSWKTEAPFSLDIQSESLTSIQTKLSDDFTDITDDLRQSYYLDDGRVVEVTWNDKLGKGIQRILVVRLGVDIEFELPESE